MSDPLEWRPLKRAPRLSEETWEILAREGHVHLSVWHDWVRRAEFPSGRMLTEPQEISVITFPGGTGTADMVGKARKAGIEVLEIT